MSMRELLPVSYWLSSMKYSSSPKYSRLCWPTQSAAPAACTVPSKSSSSKSPYSPPSTQMRSPVVAFILTRPFVRRLETKATPSSSTSWQWFTSSPCGTENLVRISPVCASHRLICSSFDICQIAYEPLANWMSCTSFVAPSHSEVHSSSRQSHRKRGPVSAAFSPAASRKCVAFTGLSPPTRYIMLPRYVGATVLSRP